MMEIEILMIVSWSIAMLAGFVGGLIVMGRHFQKELLGHGRWDYSAQKVIDEVKSKLKPLTYGDMDMEV